MFKLFKKIFFVFVIFPFSCQRNPEYFYKEGNSFFASGNYYRAIESYTKAIMSQNKFPQAIVARGLAYEKLGDRQKAIYEYEKSIKVDKNYLPAYNNLASIYIEARNYRDAIYYLNEALKIDSNYHYAYYSRGLCYYYTKNYSYAYADFSMAYDIGKKENALYYKALSASKLGKYDEAISCLDQLIASNPKNEILLFERGKNKLMLKDITAESDFSKAIEIKEKEIYYYYRARALLLNGQVRNALNDIVKAIDMSGGEKADYFYLAGDIYLALSDRKKALEMYKSGFELDGDSKLYNFKISQLKGSRMLKKRRK